MLNTLRSFNRHSRQDGNPAAVLITVRFLILACVVSLFLFNHAGSLEAKTGIDPGDQALDFTIRDLNNDPHTLSSYRGEVVVLYFSMWCTTCRANTLELQRELYLPLKDNRVKVFAVDYLGNKKEEIRSITKDLGLLYPVLLDDHTLTGRYGRKMSITLVVDRNGVIQYRDFYDLEKVKASVAKAAGVQLPKSAPSGREKKESSHACPLPQRTAFPGKQVFYGSSPEEFFGFAVPRHAVDLNKDGFADAIVGTPSSEGGQGAVFIRYGTRDGFPEAPDATLAGEKTGDRFGASILAWDMNNDGFMDLAVGGGMSRESRGRVFLFQNAGKGPARKPVGVLQGAGEGDWFGSALAAGDINRDGFTDLAVAASNDAGKGAVYLYFGRKEGVPEKADAVIRGQEAHDYFGSSLDMVDMNGDGYADLIVGAPGANRNGTDRGALYIFPGTKDGPGKDSAAGDAELIIEGEADMDGFGGALSCASDLDGDGYRDLVIGASGSSRGAKRGGAVYLFYGPPGKDKAGPRILRANDAGLVLTHGATASSYASSLTGLGDVNGDGIDDLAVGAMNAQENPALAGAVYIYYGNEERKSLDHDILLGAREDGRFGRDISPLGKAGFLVTETGNSERVKKGGAVHVFSLGSAHKDETKCSVCGMVLDRYRHTRYEVTEKDGTKHATCGVQCGLVLEIRLKEKVQSAEATDFITGEPGDAAKMFYVYKSEAVPDMWPSFIAFTEKSDAEKFRKGFGGEVLNHAQALREAEKIPSARWP